jgi:DNA-binding CsgD family transcriptional regulator/PAS domain-containing protein
MRSFEEDEFPHLLDLLYDAALDPELWPAFLDRLPQVLGAACGVLHTFDVPTAAMLAFHGFGFDPAYLASYGHYYANVNPYAPVGFEKARVGEPFVASDFLAPEIVENTEFYNDWMKPQGITTDHLAVSLGRDESRVTLFSLAPNASVYRKHKNKYRRRLSLLVPHMMRAIAINRAAARARRTDGALATSLEAIALAAFLIDEKGTLLLTNSRAEDLLRRERVLTVNCASRILTALDPTSHQRLAAVIAQALLPTTGSSASPVRLTSCTNGRTFVAWALPMRSTGGANQNQRAQLVGERDSHVLVLVGSADQTLLIRPEVIQSALKLSAAEARLASALVAGRTLAEYARANGLSRNTARNQLASALEKSGLRRQSELITVITGMLGTWAGR